MKAHRITIAVGVTLVLLGTTAYLPSVRGHDGGWDVGRAVVVPGTSTSPSHITLSRGLALRDDVMLQDGTIEMDVEAPVASQFAGIAFRVANAANYEIIYFSGSEGRWHDVQYQPLFDGEPTWQLYPGPGYHANLPENVAAPGATMHVKVAFLADRADVYVNRSTTPLLSVQELKRSTATGRIGVWTAGQSPTGMTFDGFSATSRIGAQIASITPPLARVGSIMRWQVTRRLAAPDTIVAPAQLSADHLAALQSAAPADAERDGLVNLSRIVGNPAGPQTENVFGGAGWGMALARTTIDSDRARTATLHFGYSEGIGIYLNGSRVFAGTNPYSGKDIGRVYDDANVVELPLRQGANDLVLAVTDRAFGWGFRARLE